MIGNIAILFANHETVSLILAFHLLSTGEITLYIDHRHQRKGLGKHLTNLIIERARSLGYKDLLAIIAGENEGSITLFRNLGFQQAGFFQGIGHKFGRDLDVTYLQCRLGS